MKILIETTLQDLFLLAIDKGKTVAKIHVNDLVKKADELPNAFDLLLKEANAKISDVESFYITTGPGSFMGCRTALIFVKAICQITKINLYHASTFSLISKNIDGTYFIDAKGNTFYKAIIENGNIRFSMSSEGVQSEISYEDIVENPEEYLKLFSKADDILHVDPIYLKEPRVGGE